MSRVLLAVAVVGSAMVVATTDASVVLPDGVPTIFLERGPGTGSTPMSVAYHPLFSYYYASNGGNPSFAAWVYDAAGNRIQDLGALGIDARGWNYNPNTGLLEVVAFGTGGLWEAQVDGSGLLTGVANPLLGSMPGNNGSQTMPAYDPVNDLFYSRNQDGLVHRVSRTDGSFIDSFSLDLAAAGVTGGDLTSYAIGYDPAFELLIVADATNDRALVFDTAGAFIGASNLAMNVPTGFRMGYANGQIFVFDDSSNGWQGFEVLIPGPGALALLAVAGLGGRRRRRD